MDLKELDKEAEASALKEIKNMLQRSGQLEKVDQYIVRLSRKKTSDDNLLKNQLVKQLDGVGSGLKQLKSSLEDIKDVEVRVKSVQDLLENIPSLYNSLEDVRSENTKHSQYLTAMENLKHIFTVSTSVSKAMQWIEDDKLLLAHQVSLIILQSCNQFLSYKFISSAFLISKILEMICCLNCTNSPNKIHTTR